MRLPSQSFRLIFLLASLGLLVHAADLTPPSPASKSDINIGNVVSTFKKAISVVLGNTPSIDPEEQKAQDAEDGMLRIDSDNYHRHVELGNSEDVWVLLFHTTPSDPLSMLYSQTHLNASRLAHENGNTHLKFARVNYITEVALCTRWLIFRYLPSSHSAPRTKAVCRAPWVVIATNNGQDLRFFNQRSLAPSGEGLYKGLDAGAYKMEDAWDSSLAPGGDKAWLVETYLTLLTKWSETTKGVPNWVFLLASGLLTQQILALMHGKPAPKPKVDSQRIREMMAAKKAKAEAER
ncbi:hypothetical protein P7C73_g1860, partial [Tremellales sp. Uapishka_1]